MQYPSSFSTYIHGRLILRVARALTGVVLQVEAQSHVRRYALARCVQKATALTFIIWKKYALALVICYTLIQLANSSTKIKEIFGAEP